MSDHLTGSAKAFHPHDIELPQKEGVLWLDESSIERVDKFAEAVRDQLRAIGERGDWGAKFTVSKAPASDYWRSQVIVGGEPVKKNWLQLNGQTYFHPSYSSPKPWKVQARFASPPGSPLWERKPPYVRNRQPLEWSLGGLDVWAVSYENLAEALSNEREDYVMDEILADLRASWAYANGQQQLAQDSADSGQSTGRTDITLSVDAAVWSEFEQVYASRYRARKKHPKRPSYAELRNDAVDAALMDYVAKWKSLAQA